jgi:hypothetical protein
VINPRHPQSNDVPGWLHRECAEIDRTTAWPERSLSTD